MSKIYYNLNVMIFGDDPKDILYSVVSEDEDGVVEPLAYGNTDLGKAIKFTREAVQENLV